MAGAIIGLLLGVLIVFFLEAIEANILRSSDDVERVLHFRVTDGDAFGEGRGHHRGVCVAPSQWAYRAEAKPQAARKIISA